MASSLIERCCLVYLLLLGVVPNLTLARPPQQDNSAMMMIFCGRELVAVIDEVCSASKSYSVLDPLIANQSPSDVDSTQAVHIEQRSMQNDGSKRDSLLRQCCAIGCTEDDLNSFCHTDRNRIVEAVSQQRTEELTIDWLYEFVPRYGALPPSE
ncbi:Insulin/IGF/relaxin peptide 3-like protein [Daphnia magna]|uniref:Insulin/IGF/relaxin peptide 3-like protein n=1 Tax=Daphnia magna TaxID=35525 RepID=A0A164ZSU4_9CRUS|nr:Insulin/IGF/relaxin peptide 3-like protein [Daphnia magna]